MPDFEYTDRYQALGIPYPDPDTMCKGQCEGIGVVPIAKDDPDLVFKALWDEAEAKSPADDGWHFVKCPDCGGTGERHKTPPPAADAPTGSKAQPRGDER